MGGGSGEGGDGASEEVGGGRRPSPRVVAPAQREDGAPSCPLLPLPPLEASWRRCSSRARMTAKARSALFQAASAAGALEGAHRAGKFRGGLVVAVRVASRLPEPGHEVPAECQCPTAAHSELTTRCPRPEHRWPRPATRWRCPRQDRGRHLDGHGHRRDWRGSPEEVR